MRVLRGPRSHAQPGEEGLQGWTAGPIVGYIKFDVYSLYIPHSYKFFVFDFSILYLLRLFHRSDACRESRQRTLNRDRKDRTWSDFPCGPRRRRLVATGDPSTCGGRGYDDAFDMIAGASPKPEASSTSSRCACAGNERVGSADAVHGYASTGRSPGTDRLFRWARYRGPNWPDGARTHSRHPKGPFARLGALAQVRGEAAVYTDRGIGDLRARTRHPQRRRRASGLRRPRRA